MTVLNFSNIAVATLALICTAVKAYPTTTGTLNERTDANDTSVTTYIAYSEHNTTQEIDPDTLEWVDISNDPGAENRACDPMVCGACRIVREVSVTTDSTGTWWSDWCRVAGLTTNSKGQTVGVAQTMMQTTTVSAEISISPPMLKSLQAKVGWQVSNSVGWNRDYGCYNWDGVAHGLWLQENIGWSWQTVTETIRQEGRGCGRAPVKKVKHVEINFPDPNKTGFREFQSHCDWDVKGGRTCDMKNSKHI